MIISYLHKFIFVAIPKTGTHAIRQALREQMGPDDEEQVKLFVDKTLRTSELAALQHGHISLQQLKPHMAADQFARFCKFAFVRNPFDRFVSYCSFITRERGDFDRDPRAVMRHFLFAAPPERHILFAPQHVFVTGEDGQLLADEIGRVEQMQESFDRICARLGIASRALDRVNSSRRGDYRQYYDQQLIDGVAARYARDLELFGYEY
jgi:hypothetical protein